MDTRVSVLRYLARVSDAPATDVAANLRIWLPAAGMVLLRLSRNGLVERTFDRGRRCHFYGLTAKGRARLDFLRANGD